VEAFAGGGPAAAYFFCFAKKSKQKKRPLNAAPLRGVPKKAGTETGRTGNSPSAQAACPSLSVSAPAFLASSKAELLDALPHALQFELKAHLHCHLLTTQ
jgi:hypothetical protein